MAHSRARPLHELQVSEAPHEFSENASGMPAQLERIMQSLNAECVRILQTLRHGEIIDKGGGAQDVLRVLQHVHESLYLAMACAGLLWTWQDLFKVWQRVALIVIIIYDCTAAIIMMIVATRYAYIAGTATSHYYRYEGHMRTA